MFNDKSFFYYCYLDNKYYLEKGRFYSCVDHFYPLKGLDS